MAFMAMIMGLGLLFYILLGFRYLEIQSVEEFQLGIGRSACESRGEDLELRDCACGRQFRGLLR